MSQPREPTTAHDRGSAPGLRIEVLTIFPEVLENYLATSILGRARAAGIASIAVHDLREEGLGTHRSVDDAPFGGGAGMVLAPGPVFAMVERVEPPRPLYLLSPGGRRFDQAMAEELSAAPFSLLCGRYEGVDQRITDHLVDGEISIGDFVLAGGELAALVIIEAVLRLVPGVLGNGFSADDESFTTGLLEYPQYTRPAQFRQFEVPEVLRGGNHGEIAKWREAAALARTVARRPDLIAARGGLSTREARLLLEHGYPVPAVEASRANPGAAPGDAASEERDLS